MRVLAHEARPIGTTHLWEYEYHIRLNMFVQFVIWLQNSAIFSKLRNGKSTNLRDFVLENIKFWYIHLQIPALIKIGNLKINFSNMLGYILLKLGKIMLLDVNNTCQACHSQKPCYMDKINLFQKEKAYLVKVLHRWNKTIQI